MSDLDTYLSDATVTHDPRKPGHKLTPSQKVKDSQGTVEFPLEPEDATTPDDGKPRAGAFGGIFEDGKLIEGWIEFINGVRFEVSCHRKSCSTMFKTFKHGKYQWNCGRC